LIRQKFNDNQYKIYVYHKVNIDYHCFWLYANDMEIKINLDVEMAKNKMSLKELSQRVGISMTNLSLLKTGKVKAIRFTTLAAICAELNCQPGDILEYVEPNTA
jgi:putative transcriptional regulator